MKFLNLITGIVIGSTIISCQNTDIETEQKTTLENLTPTENLEAAASNNNGPVPGPVANLYRNRADYNISDEFNGNKLDRSKWGYRTNGNRRRWGTGAGYVKMINRGGTKYVSLRGSWKDRRGSGITSLKRSHFGFYVMRWKVPGITKDNRTPWHPSVWYTSFNTATGKDARKIPNDRTILEIDFMEYWNNPVWHCQTIAWGPGKIATQVMRPNNTDFPVNQWQVHGLEYNKNYLQLWRKIGNTWRKQGRRMNFTNKPTTKDNLHKSFASPGYWTLSNKDHIDDLKKGYEYKAGKIDIKDFKFVDSWMHIDYFRYYPVK